MSDRRWFKVCCDVETIEKLDSLPGESRSQKVRDLIDKAALERFVNEDAKRRRDAAWQHAIENRQLEPR